jgi:hypothetical protein
MGVVVVRDFSSGLSVSAGGNAKIDVQFLAEVVAVGRQSL